jgi:hypothetical protein
MTKLSRLLCAALVASALPIAHADERYFTYNQEAEVIPVGRWEFEQWLTYRKGFPEGDRQFSDHIWDFREEIEYGLTERLSGSVYLNFRQEQFLAREEGLQDVSDFSFKGVSAELKYQLLNPNKKPVGLALYFEPTYNGDEIELEEKLILSKNFGDKWVAAANASFEQEWEKEEGKTEKESVLEFTAGVAYRFTPHWSAGLEGRYHSVYEGHGFNELLGAGWFAGPNVHYGSSKWWTTLTVLPQISGHPSDGGINITEHQTFEVRLLVGINF